MLYNYIFAYKLISFDVVESLTNVRNIHAVEQYMFK